MMLRQLNKCNSRSDCLFSRQNISHLILIGEIITSGTFFKTLQNIRKYDEKLMG
jgi:hypothetical protein